MDKKHNTNKLDILLIQEITENGMDYSLSNLLRKKDYGQVRFVEQRKLKEKIKLIHRD